MICVASDLVKLICSTSSLELASNEIELSDYSDQDSDDDCFIVKDSESDSVQKQRDSGINSSSSIVMRNVAGQKMCLVNHTK